MYSGDSHAGLQLEQESEGNFPRKGGGYREVKDERS